MSCPQNKNNTAASFEKIYEDELNVLKKGKNDPLIGLALSGGGIRSATFNLGVIQGLAKNKVFDKFDYLSTVSGGGYIGSWLSAWIYHKSQQEDVQNFINSDKTTSIQDDLIDSIDANSLQSKPVKFLRNYSNYLTPHASLFSMDTLSAVANYTRNLILNQSMLILTLALVLMIPRFIQKSGNLLLQNDYFWCVFGIDALLLFVAVMIISFNLAGLTSESEETIPPSKKTASTIFTGFIKSRLTSLGIFIFIVLPVIVSGWLTALIMVNLSKELTEERRLIIFLGTGAIYLLFWALGYLFSYFKTQYLNKRSKETGKSSEWTENSINIDWKKLLEWAAFTFIAGCIGGGFFLAVIHLLAPQDSVIVHWLVVVFGPPVVVLIFSLMVVFHIGLMGREFSVSQHEWWNRLAAPLITAMAAWLGIFAIVVFGPPALDCLGIYLSATLTTGWLASTIAGVLAGKSSATSGEKGNNPSLELVAQIAPYIFVIGLLIAVSYGLQWAYSINCIDKQAATFAELVRSGLECMDQVTGKSLIVGFAIIFSVVAVLAWRVKINLFSLHNFYRNRLTRAYLGASRPQRKPHPFTGFDEKDDIALSALAKQRPYHIINAAINFTDGQELAVQDRKATSFVFTPQYCGYQDKTNKESGFYRESKEYGHYEPDDDGFRLGSAVAVSGAAVSPSMGYHSSPPVAFLLTMFNVRLGRWCGNPGKESNAWTESDPPFGFGYLLCELFGYSSLNSEFVNLSDGGHFENLGLYELVRRKCNHIVVCDAGADKDYNFEDLAGAIRKCRTDFGVEIEFENLDDLRHKQPDNRYSKKHYARGTIDYGSYCKDRKGTLILLKPSLTETGLPSDVKNYADMEKSFPQQSTADQWFDEAQFESYRKLGFHVVQSLFDDKQAYDLI